MQRWLSHWVVETRSWGAPVESETDRGDRAVVHEAREDAHPRLGLFLVAWVRGEDGLAHWIEERGALSDAQALRLVAREPLADLARLVGGSGYVDDCVVVHAVTGHGTVTNGSRGNLGISRPVMEPDQVLQWEWLITRTCGYPKVWQQYPKG